MHGQMGECFVRLPLFLPPLFKITQFHLFPSYATFLALILNETFYWGREDQLLIPTHFPLTYGTPFFWGGGVVRDLNQSQTRILEVFFVVFKSNNEYKS